jgi:GTP cyclohydrolase II
MTTAVQGQFEVRQVAMGPLRTSYGPFALYAFQAVEPFATGAPAEEHLALVRGDPQRWAGPVLCRVNSACLTSEVFNCQRCDCKWQLDRAMEAIAEAGEGVITYHRCHEGQGHGLGAKLSSYHLLDAGVNRQHVYQSLGLPVEDVRDYRAAAAILRYLGVASVVLLSNNARKAATLETCGITVAERRSLIYDGETPAILGYLAAKASDPQQDLLRTALSAQP